MESLFIQLSDNDQFKKSDPYDWFCGPGSILCSKWEGFRIVYSIS